MPSSSPRSWQLPPPKHTSRNHLEVLISDSDTRCCIRSPVPVLAKQDARTVVFVVVNPVFCFCSPLTAGWEDRWVQSEAKSDLGKFVASAGKYYNDEAADTGIKTSEDAKFYGLSAKFDTFSNEGKSLVIQVLHTIKCAVTTRLIP